MLDDVLEIPIAKLAELAQQADEQEHRFRNPSCATGMRIVIKEMEQELAALGELLIGPALAERISGLSRRQLRRILHNYGDSRNPLYKLREVRIEGSRRHEGAKQDAPKQQVSEQNELATQNPEQSAGRQMKPAHAAAPAPSPPAVSGPAPVRASQRRRSSAREAHIAEMAGRAALRHRPQPKVSA